jgi:hypothetical protein
MDSRLSAKVVSVFLVLSVCLLGYSLMSSRADLTGTNGMVSIDSAVIIRQGDGVNYSFADDATLTKLEVKASSIELNDWLEIGAVTSSGYLTNTLYDYSQNYIKWGSDSTDASAVVTYTIGGLGNARYDCFRDGSFYRTMITDSASQVQFTYGDGFSYHIFVISRSNTPPGDLQASFEYTVDGNLVTFIDKSYGGAVMWIWNFGDDTGSTKQSPVHKYTASGTYIISLTVYDADGHSSKASVEFELKLGPDFPIERNPSGWDIFITDDLTVSISAVGLLVGGAIMYVSALYLRYFPIITPKGRKLVGALMVLAGLYFLIFIDNSWMKF